MSRYCGAPFREFEFHGFTGKRRVVSFGWRYDFNGGGLTKRRICPTFLLPVRARAEAFAEIAPGSFQQVLVTEYTPGAAIGWHKDRSVFGDVVGISLLSACTFRLRRKRAIDGSGASSPWSRALSIFCADRHDRMGAQHPRRRQPPLFDHVPQRARRGFAEGRG